MIKFRAKSKDTDEWVYGDLLRKWIETKKDDGRIITYIINQCIDEQELVWNESFEIIPKSLGQYIGVNDKNDKEIYGAVEIDGQLTNGGDIISDGEKASVVYFSNGSFQTEAFHKDYLFSCSDTFEIVDNEWEHPYFRKNRN